MKPIMKYIHYLVFIPLLFLYTFADAQVSVTSNDTVICQGGSATLHATAVAGGNCSSLGTLVTGLFDDNVVGPFNIGFSFCFYGQNYTQFYVGSNNWIGFSAGQTGTWVTTAIPNGTGNAPRNCIMAPWQDINPGLGGQVRYTTVGVAPNRKLVVTFCQIPMFSCTTISYTSQIICYEGTNIVETHIQDRQICATWNSGNAVHGIHNNAGTQAVVVPGRNNTAWAATNDGRRWTPTGAGAGCAATSTYALSTIPFAPVYSNVNIIWASFNSPGAPVQVGTGPSVTVSPTQTTTYRTYANSIGAGTATDSVVVTVDVQNVNIATTNIQCAGGAGGSMVASVPAYGSWDYIWTNSNGVPVFVQPNLNGPSTYNPPGAGIYACQVTDSLGCVFQAQDTIVDPPVLNVGLVTMDSLLCFGSTSGTFTVAATGGTPPYTYASVPALPNVGGIFGNVTGGFYDVTVTDSHGCTSNTQVSYYQVPQPFQVSLSQIVDVNCYGYNNGQINLTPSGGIPPYVFTMSGPVNQVNATGTFTDLPPGNYSIHAEDFFHCSYDFNLSISGPMTPLGASISYFAPVICYGDTTGQISVTCTGGTPPYTVSNSINTYPGNPAVFPDVFSGADEMLVVDANQCLVIVPYVMTQPSAPLDYTISAFNNVTCLPSIDGTISLNVTGGWPTNSIIYHFDLFDAGSNDTVASNNNGVFGNLSGGGYYIHITDSMGCVDTLSFTITSPDTLLMLSVDVHDDIVCHGDSSGYVAFSASGGFPPYQYFVDNVLVPNGIAGNLPPGAHTLTVKDSFNCSTDTIIVIIEPDLLQVTLATQDSVTCYGACNGQIQATAIGGNAPYTFILNGILSNNTGTFTGVCAGPYTVVVFDARGCSASFTYTMLQPAAPLATVEVLNDSVSCYGGSNGMLYVQALGGTPTYTYTITGQVNGYTATNQNGVFPGLAADDYDIQVTDHNLCTFTSTHTVGQALLPLQLTVSGTQNVICNGDTTGHICFNALGGTLPYTYQCSDNALVQPEGNLGSGPCFYGLNSGSYSIRVIDAYGCSVTQQASITQPPTGLTATATINPVKCYGGSDGTIAVNAVGGTPGYTYAINTNPFNFSTVFVFNNMNAGIYNVTILDANQCSFVLPIQVSQPLLPLSSQIINQVPLRCHDDTNACVTVAAIVNSGTPPYQYIYATDTTTSGLICNLGAGEYNVRVRDANGCVYIQPIEIPNPAKLEASFTESRNVTCFGGSDGMLKAQGIGGTPGTAPAPAYIYHWPGVAGNPLLPVVNGLIAQTYAMYVEDINQCVSDTIYATLTQPEELKTISVGQTDICIGNSTTLTINATGGTPGYVINWFPNGITPTPPISGSPLTVDPSRTTNFLVQVTDASGCKSIKDTIKITVHPLPTALFTTNPPIGCQGICVTFNDISLISSTTGDYISQSHWVYGDNTFETKTNPEHCYDKAGLYSVRLVSETNYGCKDTIEIQDVITVHPNPMPEFTYGPQPTTLIDPVIQFQVVELENNQYYWNLGDGTISSELNPIHTYADTGSYCVTLRQISENGCIDSLIKCVRIDPNYTLFVPNAFTPNGDQINDRFTIVGTYIAEYSLVVMDRWGQVMFTSASLDSHWDGMYNGEDAQEGVYTWQVKATDTSGKSHRKNGQVSLIR